MAIGNIQAGSALRLTASGVVKADQGVLIGFFVASSTSGTVKLWDNASAGSGTVLLNTTAAITAPAYFPCPVSFSNGLYATIGGTADITFIYA